MKRTLRLTAMALLLAASAFAGAQEKQKSDKPIQQWGDSPEAYYMTTNERIQWATVAGSPDAAQRFIADYWTRRGGEPFRQEVLARIKAADQYFSIKDMKGSETEKGRVFMILGAPNQQHEQRAMEGRSNAPSGDLGNFGQNNALEAQARSRTTWVYKTDRLPQALGVPEMTVTFQTDVSRALQVIENPGLIDPYLQRVVDYRMKELFAKVPAPKPQAPPEIEAKSSAAPAAVPGDAALWSTPEKLNGAVFTGDSFVSPTEKPFYAFSFYLPKLSFAYATDVVVVGSIKDASGKEVATLHEKLAAPVYDSNGDRFVDGSVELPAGKYSAALALYDATEKNVLANVKRDIEVADPSAARVSPLFLTSRIDTLDSQKAFDPFTFIATKYVVKGDRRFQKSDKIGFFTFIANPAQPSLNMKMKVTKDGQVIDPGSWTPVELAQTGPHTYLLATQFPAATFEPGHYKIELMLRDAKSTTYNESADFEIPN